ncbi:MAG: hypothetical protein BWY59_01705 [Verrucomicrobia bacterium ADurb.Bin345]|nr:MAG: hypothetical protein BWY59_01705 [Verrucomicrobia bacterium ADurb.Bin345]
MTRRPFARESCSRGASSGTMPYFEGPNSALWVDIRNITTYRASSLRIRKAAMPSSMAPISSALEITMMSRLLCRSASTPEPAEKSRKGSTKTTPLIPMTRAADSGPRSAMMK